MLKREVSRKANDTDKRRVEVERFFVEGLTLRDEGQGELAVKKFEETLKGWEELNDNYLAQLTALEISVYLNNQAVNHLKEGNNLKALELLNKAIPLIKTVNNQQLEATLLSNINVARAAMGNYQEALKSYEETLILRRQTGDKQGEAATLAGIGALYYSIGQMEKALEFLNQSLNIMRQVGDKDGEAKVLTNIGAVYDAIGEKSKALDYYNLSRLITLKSGDIQTQAQTLSNLGATYYSLAQFDEALKYLNQSLPLLRQVGDKQTELRTLTNIGAVYETIGNSQEALKFYLAALSINRSLNFKLGEAGILRNLMSVNKDLGNSQLAIFYGKQTINIYQKIRSNIANLEKETQQTYIKSIEIYYRYLADILIAEGRVAEAEQILGMLKEEEFFEYLRRDDKAARELKATIKLTPTEEEAFKRYEEIADEITRIGREFGELEKESKKFPVGKFPRQAEMDKLDAQLADARKVFNKFLEELDARFRNKETKEKDARVAQISGTKALLDSLNQPRTVIISTIAGEDRLNLIVTTSKINRAHTVDIKAADLNKLVVEFREAVKNPQVDPRPLGKKLYDVLFPADLQKDLAGVEADTIVWSLDGTLRYVPVSALWDGEKYLVERYSNAILTLASRDKIDKTQAARTNWTALGLGVSQKFETFPALTAVPQELCRVVQDERKKAECLKLTNGKTGVFGGINLSDGEFTFESFRLHLGRYPIVHIASHFSLNAGTESDSYLLLGGGKTSDERKLTISAVREKLDLKFNGTELLVLSACNTAMSSGENSSGAEIEGFGALAQEQGAKTVLASLWSVADDSTRDLMTEFYGELEKNPSTGKAEALRKAQIKLINGKYKTEDAAKKRGTEIINFDGNADNLPKYTKDPDAPFAHPYFWSPFILFGNWK